VPSKAGAKMFEAMAARGVEVDVLTNSLAATDVAMVHAGYARYRRQLLKAGVRLWEMKGEASRHPAGRGGALAGLLRGSLGRLRRDASAGAGQGTEPGAGLGGVRRRWRESRRRKRASARGTVLRSSRSSLHAKTFTSDGERLFVGSFNFDPRSMHLNTELGFLMDSPTLALRLQQVFSAPLRHSAYELRLGPDGALQWLEEGEAGTLVHAHEPETGRLLRAKVVFWGLMPIEWLL
jgi:putative cardiolipin synthase